MQYDLLRLELDTGQASRSLEQITGQLGGLEKVLTSLSGRLTRLFAGLSLTGYLVDAAQAAGRLDDEFLVMRLALGKLRIAIGQAVEPIGKVLLPMLNAAIFSAIRFVSSLGRIIRALFGMTDSTYDAADATDALTQSTVSAGKAARKTLAAFDRLERLNAPTGGGGLGTSGATAGIQSPSYRLNLPETLVVNQLKAMLADLEKIDLTPLSDSLGRLRDSLKPFTHTLLEALDWAWQHLFVPMAQWSAEQLLPAFVDTLAVAVDALGAVIEACKPALAWLWENFLLPVARWTGQTVLDSLAWLRERLEGITQWMQGNEVSVDQLAAGIALVTAAVWLLSGGLESLLDIGRLNTGSLGGLSLALDGVRGGISLVTTLIRGLLAALAVVVLHWDSLGQAARDAWEGVKAAWSGSGTWLKKQVLTPMKEGFRSTINGIIGFFNGLITGAVTGINAMVKSVNKLKFTVPDWVPGIGGEKLGFSLKTVSAPKIPYLAQGAVLPANRPFLAVVGDQRHGTNIEAPLATIQEAVRQVTGDQAQAVWACLGVQKQILEAVLGIHIGDEVIGSAAERYRARQAVITGL